MKNLFSPARPTPEVFNAPDFGALQLELNQRRQASQATTSGLKIRRTTPGLNRADVLPTAEFVVGRQVSQALGTAGEEAAIELAACLADTMDAQQKYLDLLKAVPLDERDVARYLEPGVWEWTTRNVQNMVLEAMKRTRLSDIRQVEQEIENTAKMLEQVDRCSPKALEMFERRRLYRQGIHNEEQDRRIAKMKEDGLIPVDRDVH